MKKLAVIIPLYQKITRESEHFSINNTLEHLSNRDIYFIAPNRMKSWLKSYINQINRKERKQLVIFDTYFDDVFFRSRASYNKLMLSTNFYKNFINYEYLLIVQTDALILQDNLDEWISKDYSYIGAPWFEGWDRPVKPLRFIGSGNGGFSLRKVKHFIQVLEVPRYIPNILAKPNNSRKSLLYALDFSFKFVFDKLVYAYNFWPLFPRVNEDTFWGILVPHCCNFFKVPSPTEAAFFSFEVEPAYLYELTKHHLPTGCHAWEKYDYQFWKRVLKAWNIP